MYKVLLSAFACDPTKGSEPGYGWNWATGLAAKGFEVHCITRSIAKKEIESRQKPANLYFYYLELPFGLERLYSSSAAGMYTYYILWQWFALRKAREIQVKNTFHVAHHVTWGSSQMGSFLYKLNVPFIFGPAGGGQEALPAFKKYFLQYWANEEKRNHMSRLMLRYNPACKSMFRKAKTIIVSNPETLQMVKSAGAKNVEIALDASLPDNFYPPYYIVKDVKQGRLKLLWTGRFLPRKGVLLLLDVMQKLKSYKQITLTVVGDGEMREPFLKTLQEYGLNETVFWKGSVTHEEIKEYYANHDVFFFTSLRDSCPPQCIEAMAYGMPVVTLNLHGQGFIVNDDTGIRCNAGSPEIAIHELKDAILKLANDPALIKKMSIAASAFASKQRWPVKINTIVEQYYPKA